MKLPAKIFRYDFVRAVSTVFIVLVHYNVYLYQDNVRSDLIFMKVGNNASLARLGVELFIVMSGTLSVFSMKRCADRSGMGRYGRVAVGFYLKKAAALMPLFYLAYFTAFIYDGAPMVTLKKPEILYTVFGLDGYVSHMGIETFYRVGEWFLGLILLCYLVCPLLYFCIRKWPKATLGVLIVYYIAIMNLVDLGSAKECDVLVRIFDFALGMYIGMYVRKISLPAAAVSLVVFIVLMCLPAQELNGSLYLTLAEGISLYFILQYAGDQLQRLTGTAGRYIRGPISYFSTYSYSVFLLHSFIMRGIIRYYHDSAISNVKYVVLFIYCFVMVFAAAVILQFAERAIENAVRERIGKTKEFRTLSEK